MHLHPCVKNLFVTLPLLHERKLLLQIVQLNALDGGFVWSFVVMASLTYPLILVLHVLFLALADF